MRSIARQFLVGYCLGIVAAILAFLVASIFAGCSSLKDLPIDKVPNELKVVEYRTNVITNVVYELKEVPVYMDRYFVPRGDGRGWMESATLPPADGMSMQKIDGEIYLHPAPEGVTYGGGMHFNGHEWSTEKGVIP